MRKKRITEGLLKNEYEREEGHKMERKSWNENEAGQQNQKEQSQHDEYCFQKIF